MPYKDPEKTKEYNKEWRENNKEYLKEYHQNNKERIKNYKREHNQTEQGMKIRTIAKWKYRGVVGDLDEIYDIYISTDFCHYCHITLTEGNYGSNRKCLDHNHKTGEIRGILCHTCNLRDVLKLN